MLGMKRVKTNKQNSLNNDALNYLLTMPKSMRHLLLVLGLSTLSRSARKKRKHKNAPVVD